ncbi:unnamed protein product [Didymodactylos carnosus]|uniref:Uncharacterized protein n=1 Tax=Didymodactylos carnosus TaxID=1234261 RepID=A0A814IGW8_9BILA|nr:unnamed protein product [Didymodactylos carnosus]CAF1024268.1 unnamed protein product [Didymodactylos carnosus]CAF3636940.1 unnamed protein product [Didymodactylos carnosus]CAF3795630.1 unnamed protein product [Didymodactylos carnosus]
MQDTIDSRRLELSSIPSNVAKSHSSDNINGQLLCDTQMTEDITLIQPSTKLALSYSIVTHQNDHPLLDITQIINKHIKTIGHMFIELTMNQPQIDLIPCYTIMNELQTLIEQFIHYSQTTLKEFDTTRNLMHNLLHLCRTYSGQATKQQQDANYISVDYRLHDQFLLMLKQLVLLVDKSFRSTSSLSSTTAVETLTKTTSNLQKILEKFQNSVDKINKQLNTIKINLDYIIDEL